MDASSCDEDENSKPTSKKKKTDNNINGFVDEDEKGAKQKNQNSVSKSKARNKKAKKLQRMAMMGEGLDSVTFSDVSDKVLNGMEPADEDMEEDLSSNYGSQVNGFVKSNAMSSAKRQPAVGSQGDRKRKKKN